MNTAKHVLLIDDDEALRDMLASQLAQQGDFRTEAVATGAEGLAKAQREAFDVVILDIGLPDMDGREVCRRMRGGNVKCPIILLTAVDGDAETVVGLDAGANDYIVKPFRLSVLLARLRAHIRQHERSDDAQFVIGPYTFWPSAKMLMNAATKKRVRLTEKETAILKYLYRCGGRAVSREVLLDEVWGYNAGVTTHTLETHVYRLRQKIETDPGRAELLLTEPGGYRLAT
ncbi:MAG: response regulator transcription factor [Rhodospirillales bacterium]|nr:response regulator transcription factor [Rhodospirillales bacterium]